MRGTAALTVAAAALLVLESFGLVLPRPPMPDLGGDVRRRDDRPRAERIRSFDHVGELANVPGPVVGPHGFHGVFRNMLRRATESRRAKGHEVVEPVSYTHLTLPTTPYV